LTPLTDIGSPWQITTKEEAKTHHGTSIKTELEPETFKPNLSEPSDLLEAEQIEKVWPLVSTPSHLPSHAARRCLEPGIGDEELFNRFCTSISARYVVVGARCRGVWLSSKGTKCKKKKPKNLLSKACRHVDANFKACHLD
jgi:hypothetical protein